jgi:hypothetical protein
MSLPTALKSATHPSPRSDDDSDILVSTASTSSEYDPDFDSSTESKEEEKSPRLRSKETQLPAPATPTLKSRMAYSKPILRSNYELPELPSDPTDEITASPSSSASTSAPSSPASPASPTKFRPANVQLAPLLANLIRHHQDYLKKMALDSGTVEQLIAIVSEMPTELRGDTRIGSIGCSEGLRQVTSGKAQSEALIRSLRGFTGDFYSTQDPGERLVNVLVIDILLAMTKESRKPLPNTLDATLQGNAAWLPEN